jgi:AcrR family transcriptional regulator
MRANKRAKRGPGGGGSAAGTLSRARVCAEALALVDEEGLAALSMRRLGARLGVEAMSLYRHVRDKADLLDALHVAVLGSLRVDQAAAGDWRAAVGGATRALRQALLAHPNVAPLFTSLKLRAPEAAATVETTRAALRAAGLSPDAAIQSVEVVGIFAIGHCLFETSNPSTEPARIRWRQRTFELGLESLLDGIAQRIAGEKRRPPRKKRSRP